MQAGRPLAVVPRPTASTAWKCWLCWTPTSRPGNLVTDTAAAETATSKQRNNKQHGFEVHCMFAGPPAPLAPQAPQAPQSCPSPSALGPLSLGLYQGGWRQPWHGLPRGLGPAETGLQILMVPKSTSLQYLVRLFPLVRTDKSRLCICPVLFWLTNGGTVLQATALITRTRWAKAMASWELDNQTPMPKLPSQSPGPRPRN